MAVPELLEAVVTWVITTGASGVVGNRADASIMRLAKGRELDFVDRVLSFASGAAGVRVDRAAFSRWIADQRTFDLLSRLAAQPAVADAATLDDIAGEYASDLLATAQEFGILAADQAADAQERTGELIACALMALWSDSDVALRSLFVLLGDSTNLLRGQEQIREMIERLAESIAGVGLAEVSREEQNQSLSVSDTSRNVASAAASGQLSVRPAPGELMRRSWQTRLPRWANKYVRRQEYHEIVRDLAIRDGRVVLVGLPGFGKTRLAREVAIEIADETGAEVIWLRGDARSECILDMSNELALRGAVTTGSNDRIAQQFAALVATAKAKPVVVIDNAQDYELIYHLLPGHLDAIVLITVRQRFTEEAWPHIEITAMSAEEARALARQQFPAGTSDDDLTDLVEALAAYPLAILHAAALLGKSRAMSVSEFCSALRRDAADVFDRKSRGDRALTFIYRTLLGRLEQENAEAADLLKIISFVRQTRMPQVLLQKAFEAIPRHRDEPAPGDYGQLDFTDALDVLDDYVVVTMAADDIEIHQLVQALFRSLTRKGDFDIAGAVADGLMVWLSNAGNSVNSDVDYWGPTVKALVDAARGRNLRDDVLMRLGELLALEAGAAISAHNRDSLVEVKQSWLYKWATDDSGERSEAISYLRYIWLRLSDSEYERTTLAGLAADVDCSQLTFHRKSRIAGLHEWKPKYDKPPLSWVYRTGSIRLLDPVQTDIRVANELLANGNFYEAYRRVSSFLANAAVTGSIEDATRSAAYLLLARIQLRRLDVGAARHYLNIVKTEMPAQGRTLQSSFLPGQVFLLEGDIGHIEYFQGAGNISEVQRCYERARDAYRAEMIPMGYLEAERKLACAAVHGNRVRARARLLNLRQQAKASLHLPIYHRIELSLAKLAILNGNVGIESIDRCWAAADFYSGSRVPDRYWYVESLIAAYCIGLNCGAQDAELSLLHESILREAQTIGREDKAHLVANLRRNAGNVVRLLAD